MMRTNSKTFNTYGTAMLLCLVLLLAGACTKKDIAPEPVGAPVPYTAAAKSWRELMNEPAYSFWKAAWSRSEIETMIKNSASPYFTLFMPTNQAFQEQGWTLDKINAAPVAELDSLLAFHVIKGFYKPGNFSDINGNLLLSTVLKRADMDEYSEAQPYIYKLFAGKYNDSLLLDGVAAAKWGTGIEATDGYVYPVAHLLHKPEMTIWQYLESDPRFSLFVAAIRLSDEVYTDAYAGINHENNLKRNRSDISISLFAPTNRSFQQSGFQSVDDIRAYIEKALPLGWADLDEDMYFQQPKTSMDSLLLPLGLNVFEAASNQYTYPMNLSYLTNDLLQNGDIFSGLLLKPGEIYNNAPVRIPLAFSNNNGKVMVKRLGSAKAPSPLAQTNIRTFNGVIHVLDEGLLMP